MMTSEAKETSHAGHAGQPLGQINPQNGPESAQQSLESSLASKGTKDEVEEPTSPNRQQNDMLDNLDAFMLPFMPPALSISPRPATVQDPEPIWTESQPSLPLFTSDQGQGTSLPPPAGFSNTRGADLNGQGIIPVPVDDGLNVVPNGPNTLPELVYPHQQRAGPAPPTEGLQPVYTNFDRAPEPVFPNAQPYIPPPTPNAHEADDGSNLSISEPKRPSIKSEWSKASSGLITATSRTYLATKIATRMALQETTHALTKPVKTSTDYMNNTIRDSNTLVDKVLLGSTSGLKRMLSFPVKESNDTDDRNRAYSVPGTGDSQTAKTAQQTGAWYRPQEVQVPTSSPVAKELDPVQTNFTNATYNEPESISNQRRSSYAPPNEPEPISTQQRSSYVPSSSPHVDLEDLPPPAYDCVTPSSATSTPSTISKSSYAPFGPDDVHARTKVQRKPLPPAHGASFDSLNRSLRSEKSKTPITILDTAMHNIWANLLAEEENFIDRLAKFRRVFYDAVIKEWPGLEKDLGAIAMGGDFIALHSQHLLTVMRSDIPKADNSTCDPSIFDNWIAHAEKLFREYSQNFPQSERSLRYTGSTDSKFSSLIDTLGLSIIWFGKNWEQYLRLPLIQLSAYVDALEMLVARSQTLDEESGSKNAPQFQRTLQSVQTLRDDCVRLADEAQRQAEIQDLHRRIRAVESSFVSNVNLSDPARHIIFEGTLAFKANGHGSWQPIYAILLDNYLVWGKDKPPAMWKAQAQEKKTNNMWVYEVPIYAPHLEYTQPQKDKYEKSGFMDDIPRGQKLFAMTVKDRTSSFKPHSFAAYSVHERQDWIRCFDLVRENPA